MKIIDTTNFFYSDFQEEIVIVNISSGIYYSLIDDAPAIFRIFLVGCEIETLKLEIVTAFGESHLPALEVFIETLIDQQLLVDLDPANNIETSTQLNTDHFSKNPKYTIEIQDDISDLLKLDPIHDVSNDKGWPKKK